MGKIFEQIDDELASWIRDREMFFVATAPLDGHGLINCSPKGLDSFRILNSTTVAYSDFNGSGIETAAHLKENGRIVFLSCAFNGPRLVRLHGTGKYHELGTQDFDRLQSGFEIGVGIRGIVEVSLSRISDSCGYGVPKFEFVGQRDALVKYCDQKGEDGLADYRREKNLTSIEGLPGFGS